MHELSIAREILHHSISACKAEQGNEIKRIQIEIGTISGVDKHSLEMAFPIVAAGTQAEKAILEIVTVSTEVFCNDCKVKTSVEPPFMICSKCSGNDVVILHGQEILIKQIEINKTTAYNNDLENQGG